MSSASSDSTPVGKASSDSSSNSSGHTSTAGGGVRLDTSPYRPPHLRAAMGRTHSEALVAQAAIEADNSNDPLVVNEELEGTSAAVDLTVENLTSRLAITNLGAELVLTPTGEVVTKLSAGSLVQSTSAGQLVKSSPLRKTLGERDAQSMYASAACVFVANLPEAQSDVALAAALTKLFLKWGPVWVKIRRDRTGMPFAFAQYTEASAADAAIANAKGAVVLGRPCRVEVARANCTFLIYRKHRDVDITLAEAQEVVYPYGAVVKMEPLSEDKRQALQLPFSILVEFRDFDCERNIIHTFRTDRTYRVQAYDPKKVLTPRVDPDQDFLRRYENDRKCIFIGGLPKTISESDIRSLFGQVGEVQDVQVIDKNPSNVSMKPFAFVAFERPDMAVMAARQLNNSDAFGQKIRVELKQTKDIGPQRNILGSPRHTPRRPLRRVVTTLPANARESYRLAGGPGFSPVKRSPAKRSPAKRSPVKAAPPAQVMGTLTEANLGNIPEFQPAPMFYQQQQPDMGSIAQYGPGPHYQYSNWYAPQGYYYPYQYPSPYGQMPAFYPPVAPGYAPGQTPPPMEYQQQQRRVVTAHPTVGTGTHGGNITEPPVLVSAMRSRSSFHDASQPAAITRQKSVTFSEPLETEAHTPPSAASDTDNTA